MKRTRTFKQTTPTFRRTRKVLKPGSEVLFKDREASVVELIGPSPNRLIYIRFKNSKYEISAVQESDLKPR